MKLITLKCPNCSANLEIEDDINTFYCKYCGYKILLDGQSKYAYKAKTEIKSFEHKEKLADKQYEHEEKLADKHYDYEKHKFNKTLKSENRILFIILGWFIFLMVISYIGFGLMDKTEKAEERKLEEIVIEVQEAIDNNDFDDAYIKAQSIVYTGDSNDSLKEKWDKTREEVIDRIIEAEIRETGKSTHKSERNIWQKIKNIFD